MEQDLDRGDKAAPVMSLLGLRMLVTALRLSLEHPTASTASRIILPRSCPRW